MIDFSILEEVGFKVKKNGKIYEAICKEYIIDFIIKVKKVDKDEILVELLTDEGVIYDVSCGIAFHEEAFDDCLNEISGILDGNFDE